MMLRTTAEKVLSKLNRPNGHPEQCLRSWENKLALSQPLVYAYLLGEARSNSFKNSFLVCFEIFHTYYATHSTPLPKVTTVELRELILQYDEVSYADLLPYMERECPMLIDIWEVCVHDRTSPENIRDVFQGISFCWWLFRETKVLGKMN